MTLCWWLRCVTAAAAPVAAACLFVDVLFHSCFCAKPKTDNRRLIFESLLLLLLRLLIDLCVYCVQVKQGAFFCYSYIAEQFLPQSPLLSFSVATRTVRSKIWIGDKNGSRFARVLGFAVSRTSLEIIV